MTIADISLAPGRILPPGVVTAEDLQRHAKQVRDRLHAPVAKRPDKTEAAPKVPPNPLDPMGLASPDLAELFPRIAVGPCNAHVLKIAAAFLGGTGGDLFYLHGPSGSGKTAILNALAAAGCGIVDNVDATPDAVARALNASGAVAMSGPCPPRDIAATSLRTLCRGALSAGLLPLDRKTIRLMLDLRCNEQRILSPNFYPPKAILDRLARVDGIDGHAVNGLVYGLYGAHVTGERYNERLAQRILSEAMMPECERRPVRIETVKRAVCADFSVTLDSLISQRRSRDVVVPRMIAMYLCKTMTPRSYPEIGRAFGGRDHTTVMNAVRKIDAWRKEDPAFNDRLAGIERRLARTAP